MPNCRIPAGLLIPANFPESIVASAENRCRNPDDRSTGPYCYLANTVGNETCDIPKCPGMFNNFWSGFTKFMNNI